MFIERLKMLMKEQNITQQELADKLSISRKTISLWCIGRGFPDSYNLKALIDFFVYQKNGLLVKLIIEMKKIISNTFVLNGIKLLNIKEKTIKSI